MEDILITAKSHLYQKSFLISSSVLIKTGLEFSILKTVNGSFKESRKETIFETLNVHFPGQKEHYYICHITLYMRTC